MQLLGLIPSAKSLVAKTVTSWQVYKPLFKDALAPAIGLAANQATPWSGVFGTLGFLVPMVSIISHPSPPRATFLKTWFMNVVGSCVSAAVTVLAFYCVVKARINNGDAFQPYSAAASAVAALWLIVQTYIASAVRYSYPETTWTISICLIFSNYGMVYAVQFLDMSTAFTFLQQLFLAHLVGLAISAGVALLMFPCSCREVFFDNMLTCANEMKLALRGSAALLEEMTKEETLVSSDQKDACKRQKAKMESLQAELDLQASSAQNELAWGKLDGEDVKILASHLGEILIPLIGLSEVPEVLENALRLDCHDEKLEQTVIDEYRELSNVIVQPYSEACVAAEDGIQQLMAILEIDLSTSAGAVTQSRSTLERLEHAMQLLVDSKSDILHGWSARRTRHSNDVNPSVYARTQPGTQEDEQSRDMIHMLLYIELLLWSTCRTVYAAIEQSEQLMAARKVSRLLMPWRLPWSVFAWKSLRSSIAASNEGEKLSSPPDGSGHRRKPKNSPSVFLLLLLLLHRCTRFFASSASGFALRVVCATMSIAVVAYLPSSQDFYIQQHLIWAQYAVSFSMLGSAGQSVRALSFRLGGTVVAACLAWVSWYIVVGIPAGVLVMYWLSIHLPMYVMTERPRYFTAGAGSAFALTTILGNALQPNGNNKQPTIILGAVRLAAVGGGCLLATIWTLFPFPVSERGGARKSLSACLHSLSLYHRGFEEIVQSQIAQGLARNDPDMRTHGLHDMHSRLFANSNSHLQALRTQLRHVKWNTPLDGDLLFPHLQYEEAADCIMSLTKNMQLIAFASAMFVEFSKSVSFPAASSSEPSQFLVDIQQLLSGIQHQGVGMAALLSLLSHSIGHSTSLPHSLVPWSGQDGEGKFSDGSHRLAQPIKNVSDPGSATYALIRIGLNGLQRDLETLFLLVKDIVGETESTFCDSYTLQELY